MKKMFKLVLTLVIMSCGVYSSYAYDQVTLKRLKALDNDQNTDPAYVKEHKNFQYSNLSGADLTGIRLFSVDLSNSNMAGVTWHRWADTACGEFGCNFAGE